MRSSHLQFYCDTLDLDRGRGRRAREYWMIIEDQTFLQFRLLAIPFTPLFRQQVVSLSHSSSVSPVELSDRKGGRAECAINANMRGKWLNRDNCVPVSVKKCGKWCGSMWPGVWQTVWQHVVTSMANAWQHKIRIVVNSMTWQHMVRSRVRPHFCFGSKIWNWSENFVSLRSQKKPDFTWFTSMQNIKIWSENAGKISKN